MSCKCIISHLSVCINNGCCIIITLHSSFDLQGINSGFYKLRHIRKCTHILHGHKERIIISSAAGLSAAPSVSASVTGHTAEEASSAIAVTHGTVYENLNLSINLFLDTSYLIKCKLSGRYHSACTKPFYKLCTFSRANIHLCTCMYRHIRKCLPDQRKSPEILYNNCVQSNLVKWSEILRKSHNFGIFKKGVNSQINFNTL